MRRHSILVLVIVLLSPLGCAGRFGRAVHSYEEGSYPEAIHELRLMESDAGSWSPSRRAHYALYRGLADLAVGDARAASHWLTVAKRASDRDPQLFDEKEDGRLAAAWRSMGRMPGD